MKKIRLLVKFVHFTAKELEISDKEYETIKEKYISATLSSEIAKLRKEEALDKTSGYLDYMVKDADNDTTIVDWDR